MIKEALLVQNVLLGEVCTITYGKGLPTKQLIDIGFPVFGANGIIGFYDKYIYEKSEVLISCRGAYSGKINLSPPNCFVTNNSLILSIKDDKSLSKKYLYYILNSVNKSKLVTGTAQPQVTINNAVNLSFPLPKIEVQDAIVEKIEELFSELDKSIENLKTVQQQLKVYRQAVLKWAFEGKLTNEEVKDGELPEGWDWVKITSLASKAKHSLKAGPFGSSLKKEFYVEAGYKIYGQEQVINNDPFYGDYYVNEEKYNELSSCRVKPFDILISLVGTVGKVLLLPENCEAGIINPRLIKISLDTDIYLPKFFKYYFESSAVKSFYGAETRGTTMDVLNLGIIKTIPFPFCSIQEQEKIVQEIESRLSVCDKMEETITVSLQQAEALRQSILRKAFEGKLVKPQVKPAYKPKNVYFYQMQVLGKIAAASKEKGISHGEMTIAKYAYLVDKIYQIPTYYNYKRWHLGPYPPEIKKAINNSKFFSKNSNGIEVTDIETLNKYPHPFTDQLQNAIDDLYNIFLPYQSKNRSHQIELLATVCKVIEDIQTKDLEAVRASMAEWVIDLPTTHFKSKAEKFSEEETERCLKIIIQMRWDKILIIKK